MTDRRWLLLGLVGAQAVVLGILVMALGEVTHFKNIQTVHSGPAATVATWLVTASVMTVVVAYLAIPVVTATYWRRNEDASSQSPWPLAMAVVATVSAPTLLVLALAYVGATGSDETLPAVGFLIAASGSLLVVAVSSPEDRPVWPAFLNIALVVLFLSGMVSGLPLAGVVSENVVSHSGHSPQALFEFEERVTDDGERILNVTHAGGDGILASRLTIRGEGFSTVDSANQTAPGVWQGTTTPRNDEEGIVVSGDYVLVGVTSDCRIRVVYEGRAVSSTLAAYECGEQSDAAGDRQQFRGDDV